MKHDQSLGSQLVGLSVLVQRRHAQICADHCLTPAQAQLLCMLKDQPRGMSELAGLLGLAKPGLSGLVDRIERRGLVRRETPEHDRRAVMLHTTPLGKETVDALWADVGASLPDILDVLPAEDRVHFERMVTAIITGPGACGGGC
ncbi:MarR family winged helix-turn-helix transcriptional regulator [Actinoplanes sp. GCM10030250]|uniref:MarR family winged helix-turn-helix transcriptional regulator n=1 Tax=Actinoplanes sp. GCM10030250 TaxID=3273376 RepID=UPI00360D73AB